MKRTRLPTASGPLTTTFCYFKEMCLDNTGVQTCKATQIVLQSSCAEKFSSSVLAAGR